MTSLLEEISSQPFDDVYLLYVKSNELRCNTISPNTRPCSVRVRYA
jgi:hypothetical protein